MTTVHAQLIGDQALVPRADLEQLLELARQSGEVELQIIEEDVSTKAIMRLADEGGSFGFWSEPGEDIYTLEDGRPV